MKIKIISATKRILELDEVKSVTVPGKLGQMQILPSHVDLVSTLDIGEIQVQAQDQSTNLIINGGLIVVKNDEVMILADDVSKPEELIMNEIEKSIENATKKVQDSSLSAKELIQIEKQLKYEKFKKSRVTN